MTIVHLKNLGKKNRHKINTVKELQRFLGFAHFYRRFIRNYSIITAPLTSLLKGAPKHFKWDNTAETAFEKLKTAFTTAPILQLPDSEKQFIVAVDPSDQGE